MARKKHSRMAVGKCHSRR